MAGSVVVWLLFCVASAVVAVFNYRHVLQLLACLPLMLTSVFFMFRNHQSNTTQKVAFFHGLVMGGHRGSPRAAPENTIAAFEKAKSESCQLVEFDLQLSLDGQVVIMHDDTTDRVAHENVTVKSTHSRDLKSLKLKAVNRVEGEVSTLSEVVHWCQKNDMRMMFDVKDGEPKMLDEIVNIIRSWDLFDKVMVSSFDFTVPYYLKKMEPKIITGLTSRRWEKSFHDEEVTRPRFTWPLHWLAMAFDDLIYWSIHSFVLPRFLGVDVLLLNHRDISQTLVDSARRDNMYIMAWTSNDLPEMRFFRDQLKIPFLSDVPNLVANDKQ